ncbi:MAG: hypothetical protein D6830_05225, partial [Ignavibacteria bacterium]
VYILRSLSTGRHYIGECADLSDRIKRHQENMNKVFIIKIK